MRTTTRAMNPANSSESTSLTGSSHEPLSEPQHGAAAINIDEILSPQRSRDREGVSHGAVAATEGDESTSPQRSRDRQEAVDETRSFDEASALSFRGVPHDAGGVTKGDES